MNDKVLKITSYVAFIFIVSFVFFGITTQTKVFSKSCSDIQDLDDRADCYAEKIEEKEEDYESTSKKLEEIRNKKNDISNTITGLASQLSVTQGEVNSVQASIDEVSDEIGILEIKLGETREKLSEKITLRNKIVRNYSKKTILNDLEIFFSTVNAGEGLNGFQFSSLAQAFNKAASEEAINLIKLLNLEISVYEADKAEAEALKNELETEQSRLLVIVADLGNRKASAEDEFSEVSAKESDYEGELKDLKNEIDELSGKQQEILRLKYGDENGTVGNYDTPDHKTPDPPFKPAFAGFSYGAYTHYKGMSQYGAKGRADDDDDYEDILKFYYDVGIKEKDIDKICVEGYGDMDMQKYLYGIAEMPSDWPKEALRAQAVAARSYAYRYVEKDKCICTTQSCQVFLKSKSDNPPSRWKDAVKDTKGEILKDGVVAYYSSTTGGYIQDIGWDTDGDWPDDAYEKKAKSPWFYKAWYTKSYNNSDSCGRPHPWMTEKEMADILNALVVWEHGSGDERDRISPVTTGCWGGNPYSLDQMADKADKYGEKYSEVYDIDVDISNGGYTSKVKLKTNKGEVNVSGDTFKTVFNLRAPSYIAIRSRLFDFDREN
jgi:peptidoglycan hydrolase-like amidase/predicted  nucleic acid-binding Zn-ribbon protein